MENGGKEVKQKKKRETEGETRHRVEIIQSSFQVVEWSEDHVGSKLNCEETRVWRIQLISDKTEAEKLNLELLSVVDPVDRVCGPCLWTGHTGDGESFLFFLIQLIFISEVQLPFQAELPSYTQWGKKDGVFFSLSFNFWSRKKL